MVGCQFVVLRFDPVFITPTRKGEGFSAITNYSKMCLFSEVMVLYH